MTTKQMPPPDVSTAKVTMRAPTKNVTPDGSGWDSNPYQPSLRTHTKRTKIIKAKNSPKKRTTVEKRKEREKKLNPHETQPWPPRTLASQMPISLHHWQTTHT